MESSGTANSIQVSEAVYEILKERFQFRKRGTVDVKGIGIMQTFYLLTPSNIEQDGSFRIASSFYART